MRLHIHLALLALAPCVLAPTASRAQTLPTSFSDSVVVSALDLPTAFDFLPDGRVVLVEQLSGKIRLVVNGHIAAIDPVTTVADLRSGGERGLLGVAVDPQFPARPYLYTHHTSTDGFIHIVRWTVSGDLAFTGNGALSVDPASRYELLSTLPDVNSNHNGGTVRFGPDGTLYVSLGDDALNCVAQNLALLEGKILRLRVDQLPAGPGAANYALLTPPDNPYVAMADSASHLVYAYGLRNPFRFQVDAVRGCLVIDDVGLDTYEEIDLLGLPGVSASDIAPAGANFGWPWREGPAYYLGCGGSEPASYQPIYAFDRTSLPGAATVSGGAYHAQVGARNFPNTYEGDIFFSEYTTGNVYRLKSSGGSWDIAPPESGQSDPMVWATGFEAAADWRLGRDGALWTIRQYFNGYRNTGRLERVVYAGMADVPPGVTGSGLRLSAYPTPAHDRVTLAWTSGSETPGAIEVYDLAGRVVYASSGRNVAFGTGSGSVSWDLQDGEGHRVANGIYFARLTAGRRDARCLVVVAR